MGYGAGGGGLDDLLGLGGSDPIMGGGAPAPAQVYKLSYTQFRSGLGLKELAF